MHTHPLFPRKQGLFSQISLLITISLFWLKVKHPVLSRNLLAGCSFIFNSAQIGAVLLLFFSVKKLDLSVYLLSSAVIVGLTAAIRAIFRRRDHHSPVDAQAATLSMLVFPFVLPAVVEYATIFASLVYLLATSSLIILVGETIVARRAPVPKTMTPAYLALALIPVLIIGASASTSAALGAVLAIAFFYALFIMLVFSVLSVGKVLLVVRG